MRTVTAGVVFLAVVAAAAAALADANAGTTPWTSLRRPLHLPVVAPGTRCPVSTVDRRVAWRRTGIFGGSGIGPGPVYPGLGSSDGLILATKDTQYGSSWFGSKVFWFVLPRYRGRVLIRGRRLDGPGFVGFNGERTPHDELRIEPYDSVGWAGQPTGSRGVPSGVRIKTKGCYGFQIDGTSFSRVVVVTGDIAG